MTEKNCTALEYCKENTQLNISDLFKFLYQSCFGCEHLVSDYDKALRWIVEEALQSKDDDLPCVEYLDGEYCRIHLKALTSKEELEWLCRAFIDSSKKHPEGRARLEEQLRLLIEYSGTGVIGFDKDELEREADRWREQGFPPIHHSEAFREAHHPAYRVVLKRYAQELLL